MEKNKDITSIVALSGLGEVGKNMYVVHHKDEIIIIDAGVMFPESDLMGIDYVIQDVSYLKANGNRISGSVSTTAKDYVINYQDLQGIGMTGKLALPTLIALCSIALNKPVLSSTAIMGEISISGTMIKVDELANALQVCLDSGAKKVLIPSTSFADFATVPADLMSAFQLIPYASGEGGVFQAVGVS